MNRSDFLVDNFIRTGMQDIDLVDIPERRFIMFGVINADGPLQQDIVPGISELLCEQDRLVRPFIVKNDHPYRITA